MAAAFTLYPAAAQEEDPCRGFMLYEDGTLYYWQTGDSVLDGWGYVESNFVEGLQRGGQAWHGNTDLCVTTIGDEAPDTIWW